MIVFGRNFSYAKSRMFFVALLFFLSLPAISHAVTGSINPDNDGSYTAEVMRDSSLINFGYFTEPGISVNNVVITDTELSGYAWGEKYGWISLNCANGSNSCADSDFKVENNIIDTPAIGTDMLSQLSGYAWGQNVGWINFGPFDNEDADFARVLITDGEFLGYAWGQNVGWIKFDCEDAGTCVKTDWGTQCNDGFDNDSDGDTDYPEDTSCSSTSGNAEAAAQCSDGLDNDNDGETDYPADAGCASAESINEGPACDDGDDNDNDGLIDYPADTGCTGSLDNNEGGRTFSGGGGGGGSEEDPEEDPIDPGEDPPVEDGGSEDPTPSDQGTNNGGGGGGGKKNDDDLSSVDISGDGFYLNEETPTVEETTSVGQAIQNTTNQIINTVSNTLSTDIGRNFSNIVTGAGVAIGVATAVPTLITVLNISEIALIPFRIGSLILSALGVRRKSWGIVYDSVTKQPLDPVYVSLQDVNGKEISSAITDLDGRYGFIVKKGTYKILVNKTNYRFPSLRLSGVGADEFYKELYFGEEIVIENDGDIINKNIPMDAIGVDWNEVAKRDRKIMRFYSKWHVAAHQVSKVFFYAGFLLSVFAAFVITKPYTFAILGLYALMFIMRRIGIKEKVKGVIFEKDTGYGIPFAVVRVFSQATNTQIKNCVADVQGRYLCLVANGTYYVKIDQKNEGGGYRTVYSSPPIAVKKGVINGSFEV